MPTRSDVLWHIAFTTPADLSTVVPTDERWIIKHWSFWADTNVFHGLARVRFQVFPPHGTGVAVLYTAAELMEADDLVTNGRRDHLAIPPWVIAEAGATLAFTSGDAGIGSYHFYVSGTRLLL